MNLFHIFTKLTFALPRHTGTVFITSEQPAALTPIAHHSSKNSTSSALPHLEQTQSSSSWSNIKWCSWFTPQYYRIEGLLQKQTILAFPSKPHTSSHSHT